jgi:hypothetical protein
VPVIPRADNEGPITTDTVLDWADPADTAYYYIDALRFWIVGAIADPGAP